MIINESYFKTINEAHVKVDGLPYIISPPHTRSGIDEKREMQHNNRLKVSKSSGGKGDKKENHTFGMSFPIVMNDKGDYILDLNNYEFNDKTTNINRTDMDKIIGVAKYIGEHFPNELIACYKDPGNDKLQQDFSDKLKKVKLSKKDLK